VAIANMSQSSQKSGHFAAPQAAQGFLRLGCSRQGPNNERVRMNGNKHGCR
jgi:hypothetical protein